MAWVKRTYYSPTGYTLAQSSHRATAEEITRLDELEELEEPVTETEESNHYY